MATLLTGGVGKSNSSSAAQLPLHQAEEVFHSRRLLFASLHLGLMALAEAQQGKEKGSQ